MVKLSDKIKSLPQKSKVAVWKGPRSNKGQGGITQSLLGHYLVCGERFRISTVEGLRTPQSFSKAMEYGNMWHECEEAYAGDNDWESVLKEYCNKLVKKYRGQQGEVEKWYNVCKIQFPMYIKHWSKHKDTKRRTPIVQEEIFRVPYELPSERIVFLRGKWDSVDIVGKGRNAKIWLQENKTKGEIDEHQIVTQMDFDLQTMLYLVTVGKSIHFTGQTIAGVRYNVIRRPLSGGKGSIKQKKGSKNVAPETLPEYYNRLTEVLSEDPEYNFMRWEVEVSDKCIERFQTQFLNPVLENLCDDYEWWEYCLSNGCDVWDYMLRDSKFGLHANRHFRIPYGIYNSLAKTGGTYLDEYLKNGNEVGLEVTKNLFPELEE